MSFPNAISLIRPDYKSLCNMDAKIDPNWISGFIEGDGSFIIIESASKLIPEREGLSVSAVVSIGLDIKEEPIASRLAMRLACYLK